MKSRTSSRTVNMKYLPDAITDGIGSLSRHVHANTPMNTPDLPEDFEQSIIDVFKDHTDRLYASTASDRQYRGL
jgi:hypothetical protein